jgi:hypothetical protein
MRLADVPGWTLLDVVGLRQLDLADLEIWHPPSIRVRDHLPYDLARYLLTSGATIGDGDQTEADGVVWWARGAWDAAALPPRPVIRWFPDGATPPPLLLEPKALPGESEWSTLPPHYRAYLEKEFLPHLR